MSTFVSFRDTNFTNEEGAGKILAKIVGQSVVVGAETSHRVEQKGAGADDTVDVQVGEVIIIDDDGYALGAWSDAVVNLPVTSNSSGNPRIDVVVAYVDKAVEDNSNNNSPSGLVFAIVDGTPAGAPTPPNDATIQAAVGADNPFIKLAQIAVADSFVSIVNANITDIREQFSIQSGGKKLQYNVATNTWELEDTLGVDTINEKTVDAGVTIEGVVLKDNWDEVITSRMLAPTIIEQRATSNVTLNSSSIIDITGATITFTPEIASMVIVWGVFDMNSGDAGSIYQGFLNIDGVNEGAIMFYEPAVIGLSRITVSQIWVVPLTAASHTLKLQARRLSGSGSATVVADNNSTKLVVFLVGNANVTNDASS